MVDQLPVRRQPCSCSCCDRWRAELAPPVLQQRAPRGIGDSDIVAALAELHRLRLRVETLEGIILDAQCDLARAVHARRWDYAESALNLLSLEPRP